MPFFNIFSKHKESKRIENKPRIIADNREKNSLVLAELTSLGAEVEIKHLLVADFLIRGTAVERKTVSDFLSSMLNKRLIRQLEELQQYPNKLLIIEGIDEHEIYNSKEDVSGIHPNAIRGFLLSILLKYKTPILFTKNYEDTAKFLLLLAKKQEIETCINAKKKARNKKEQMQYILEGFPGIGPKTAKKLLKKYKTIKAIINQQAEELKKDIGKKSEIFKLLEQEY